MPKTSSKSSPSRRSGRGAIRTANRTARQPSASLARLPRDIQSSRRSARLAPIEPLVLPVDRRHYNPEPALTRPARRVSGRPARVVAPSIITYRQARAAAASGRPLVGYSPSALLFNAPAGVAVCVQRKIRKQVIHAKKIAGKRGLKSGRRGPYSSVRC